MKKLFLALGLLFCQTVFATHTFEEVGFQAYNVQYDGHTFIIIKSPWGEYFEPIHHFDCMKCYEENLNLFKGFDNMFSTVQVNKPGSSYTVDQYGSRKGV